MSGKHVSVGNALFSMFRHNQQRDPSEEARGLSETTRAALGKILELMKRWRYVRLIEEGGGARVMRGKHLSGPLCVDCEVLLTNDPGCAAVSDSQFDLPTDKQDGPVIPLEMLAMWKTA